MVAFNARRLVWPAMPLISFTTASIRSAESASRFMVPLVSTVCATASRAICAALATWPPIPETDVESAPVAVATACTFIAVSLEAEAIAAVRAAASCAVVETTSALS